MVRHRDVRTYQCVYSDFRKKNKPEITNQYSQSIRLITSSEAEPKLEVNKPRITNQYSQRIRLITSSEVEVPMGAPPNTLPEAFGSTTEVRPALKFDPSPAVGKRGSSVSISPER